MEKESRRRKRRRLPATEATTVVDDLTDDLLELILLSLDSPLCLIRATASCKRWYRVVAGTDDGASFLRRFRSLHPPAPIGTYYSIMVDAIIDCERSYGQSHVWPEVDPVFVPSSASASDGLQLSLDFVPPADDGPRELVDARGSLLLLLREIERPDASSMCSFHRADYMIPDLVVCEPLTRQYQAIAPYNLFCILGAFMLDGGDDAIIGMTSFRVLVVQYEHEEDMMSLVGGKGYPCASVFTCGTDGGWHDGQPDYGGVRLPHLDDVQLAGRTEGRIYWGCDGFSDKQVMVLDERTLLFSTMALSEQMKNWNGFGRNHLRVVSGGNGTLRIVHLNFGYGDDLEVFSQTHGTEAWVLDMRVQILEASRGLPGHKDKYFDRGTNIIDVQEGSVVLSPEMKTFLFSVDLETEELKREYRRKKYTGPAFPYMLPWPPVMKACRQNGRKSSRKRRKRPSSKKS